MDGKQEQKQQPQIQQDKLRAYVGEERITDYVVHIEEVRNLIAKFQEIENLELMLRNRIAEAKYTFELISAAAPLRAEKMKTLVNALSNQPEDSTETAQKLAEKLLATQRKVTELEEQIKTLMQENEEIKRNPKTEM